jgi:hypothetical protein
MKEYVVDLVTLSIRSLFEVASVFVEFAKRFVALTSGRTWLEEVHSYDSLLRRSHNNDVLLVTPFDCVACAPRDVKKSSLNLGIILQHAQPVATL